ncbi:uncharacterized protein PFL1_04841 [Pseudozyma flocculosa PF-1]|uniref:NADP-dependent oxidoreductase domain-containing protein n=2 Tax=Pseudozyma flocculosa TaxID=84751 RepID=A0A5C3F4X0_9BASI|nr:uncharacterized protein PFL1_04841 [Pseudozyma flocculosa PF-1]EPQ27703.1 hypothetical protein PFL1_04841 [Pseudozyma flocculosa PF-1]SPO39160.1 uncharacterized protein PSFLO_04639 [Pseudozyma flocculosa]
MPLTAPDETSLPDMPVSRSLIPSLPPLLYGTAWKTTLTSPLVHLALSSGFRGVDTAAQLKHYREDLVGHAIDTLQVQGTLTREELWIQTKFTPPSGQDWSGHVPYTRDDDVATMVRKSFASSLRALHPWWKGDVSLGLVPQGEGEGEGSAQGNGSDKDKGKGKEREHPEVSDEADEAKTDARATAADAQQAVTAAPAIPTTYPAGHPYIDSYLLHSPLGTLGETLEAWTTMESFVDAGLVRRIGFSNIYDPTILNALLTSSRIPASILQNRWHHTTGHDVSLLPRLSPILSPNDFPLSPTGQRAEGIAYQTFWTLSGNPRLLSSPAVDEIATRRRLTPQQVVYAFVRAGLGLPGLSTTVLCGSTNELHIRQAVEAVQVHLDEQETDQLRREVYGV